MLGSYRVYVHLLLACTDIEYAQHGEACVEQCDRVSHKEALVVHAEDRDKDPRRGCAAPQDKQGRHNVAKHAAALVV